MVQPSARATPRALRDLEECAEYLARQGSLELGLRFLECAETTFGILAAHPGIGRRFSSFDPQLEGLRCFAIQGFGNHLVFYRPRELGIEVVRVLHGARNLDAVLPESLGDPV